MPLVQGVAEDQKDLPAPALGSHKKEHELLTDELRQRAIQAYFASITFMDAQVGRVLDTLEQLDLAGNTIVVFTSDHGYHLGEHGLWQKMSLFEESARVPLIIAAPGAGRAGGVADTPVGLIDLYPTLAELCNVQSPDNLQGQSLVPILGDCTLPGRGWTISQVTRGPRTEPTFGFTLRTPQWRYTEWDQGRQGCELYDHVVDPREQTNLAEDPDQAGRIADFSAQLRSAVAASYPESGEMPAIRDDVWAPNLTDP
jgi:iduronate 2-sulfatase